MTWPNEKGDNDFQEWKQTSSPLERSIKGYEEVKINYPEYWNL